MDHDDDTIESGVCSFCGQECDRYGVNLGCTEDVIVEVSPCHEAPVVSHEEFRVQVLTEARAAIALGRLCRGETLQKATTDQTIRRIDAVLSREKVPA